MQIQLKKNNMKLHLKRAALLLTGTLLSGSVLAQTTDSNMGSADYVKPFSGNGAYRTWSIGINGGLLTNYTPFRSTVRDYRDAIDEIGYGGFVKNQILPSLGLQLNFLKGKVSGRTSPVSTFTGFKTNLDYAFDLSLNFTLANISWKTNKSAIQPYITAGGGYSAYTPTTMLSDGTQATTKDIRSAYIPVGLGLKFNLSKGVNLDMGYQVNFVDADNFDGYNVGFSNDKYSYAHIGLEFALGSKSKPQLATHNPVSSMRQEYLMEEQKLQMAINEQKAANDQLRTDLNATRADLAKFSADSDGDGVPDFFDKCPGTPAGTKVDGSGCPLPVNKEVKVYITEEDKKIVKDAIANLEFDFGKTTLRAKSFPSLDRVAALLTEKNFSLKLAGHTDDVGSNDANLKLSKARAESIKTYLVDKGANASRVEATGYGETQPIATNKTAEGRQQNRRVEFTLY
jgi:OOP family OmpA-OmpF porin